MGRKKKKKLFLPGNVLKRFQGHLFKMKAIYFSGQAFSVSTVAHFRGHQGAIKISTAARLLLWRSAAIHLKKLQTLISHYWSSDTFSIHAPCWISKQRLCCVYVFYCICVNIDGQMSGVRASQQKFSHQHKGAVDIQRYFIVCLRYQLNNTHTLLFNLFVRVIITGISTSFNKGQHVLIRGNWCC